MADHVRVNLAIIRRGYSGSASNQADAKKRLVFSGIQPTGIPTLGNYLGCLSDWVVLQDEADKVIFSIADLHSITLPQDPGTLKNNILEIATYLLAIGINPDKAILFQQSKVAQHAQLHWILSCITPLSILHNTVHWESKSIEPSRRRLGLLSYPVLQAADILLYRASHVPVGEDQKQHIELTRDIVHYFKSRYKDDYLVLPEIIYANNRRVMSLRDATKKMSKSDQLDSSRINLTDPPEVIKAKIRRSLTDCEKGIVYDKKNRPAIANLMELYAAISGIGIEETKGVCSKMKDKVEFKTALADIIINRLTPIQSEIKHLKKEKGYVQEVLAKGAEQARLIAKPNYRRVEEIVGFA